MGPYSNPTIYMRHNLEIPRPTLVNSQLSSMGRSCSPAQERHDAQITDTVEHLPGIRVWTGATVDTIPAFPVREHPCLSNRISCLYRQQEQPTGCPGSPQTYWPYKEESGCSSSNMSAPRRSQRLAGTGSSLTLALAWIGAKARPACKPKVAVTKLATPRKSRRVSLPGLSRVMPAST